MFIQEWARFSWVDPCHIFSLIHFFVSAVPGKKAVSGQLCQLCNHASRASPAVSACQLCQPRNCASRASPAVSACHPATQENN